MAEFEEIWSFVEKTLNLEVPTYVKNITHACGFDNGIALASIDKDDIEYFVEQTRNGSVMRFFVKEKDVDVDDVDKVLHGAAYPQEKFEFSRGHSKLLLSIVEYLKKYIEDNGPNKFTLKAAKAKTSKVITTNTKNPVQRVSLKRKLATLDPLIASILADFVPVDEHSDELINEALKKHKKTLLNKMMIALSYNTPELFAKNVKIIKSKISNALVTVHVAEDKMEEEAGGRPKKETWGFFASITCPYCDHTINVFQTSIKAWGTTNFDRHLTLIHAKVALSQSAVNAESTTQNKNDNIVTSIAGDNIEIGDDNSGQVDGTDPKKNEQTKLVSKSDTNDKSETGDEPKKKNNKRKKRKKSHNEVTSLVSQPADKTLPLKAGDAAESDKTVDEPKKKKNKSKKPRNEGNLLAEADVIDKVDITFDEPHKKKKKSKKSRNEGNSLVSLPVDKTRDKILPVKLAVKADANVNEKEEQGKPGDEPHKKKAKKQQGNENEIETFVNRFKKHEADEKKRAMRFLQEREKGWKNY